MKGNSRDEVASRWRRVQDVYQKAQECDKAQRDAFLDEACSGDAELRREVESLLGYATEADRFLEEPAVRNVKTKTPDGAGPMPEGHQLGSYKIISLLGTGGMGQVYLAQDTRLGRTVAIKVVTPARIADDERKRRFMQEARAASALNHPNIVAIYDVASDSSTDFLVMEYVEGQSLHQRIPPKGLPVKEAIRYATQIVSALAAAHAAGIVHRDIKPANVMVTEKGLVKVLDFGLAKLAEPAEAGLDSPTDIARTQEGVILGTASYMSPEQASGKRVDSRADIFAVGVVLYEMLTGQRAFDRGTVLATLGAVMYEEPAPLNTRVKSVPPELKKLVERCLRKDPDRRIQTMADLKVILEDLQEMSETAPVYAEASPQTPPSSRLLWWSLAAVSGLALALSLWVLRPTPRSDPAVSRWILNAEASPGGFNLSRDGRRLVYVSIGDPQARLWVRDLNQLKGEPLVGTEGAMRPFFSPNGQWVAFFTNLRGGQLKKVPASGGSFNTRGAVTTLCNNANYYGGSWTEDDQIIFSGSSGLMRVSASGGSCESISKADPKEGDHRWPQILPGGKSVLFTIGTEGAFDSAHIAVLDPKTHRYRTIFEGGANARYLKSGHLVFARGGQMFAVPFDLDSLQVRGVPRTVVESILYVNAGGYAAYTASETGLLLYSTPVISGFQWRDRRGIMAPTTVPPGVYGRFGLSPDGERLALEQTGRGDVVVVELSSGRVTRLTSEGMNSSPVWSADGLAVTFSSLGKGIFNLPLTGDAQPRALLDVEAARPWDWAPDNRTLLYQTGAPSEIWKLSVNATGELSKPERLLGDGKIAFSEPRVSRDGRWLAYVSNESGLSQVNVKAFSGSGNKITVSLDGGIEPHWSRDGNELFFLSLTSRSLMAVDFKPDAPLRAGTPRVITPSAGRFEVHPSGERFLIMTEQTPDQLHLVENWFNELREKFSQSN